MSLNSVQDAEKKSSIYNITLSNIGKVGHMGTITVNLSIDEVIERLNEAVVGGSVTGELLDTYEIHGPEELKTVVLVYEKHYYRVGNRLTLTVTIDNFEGASRVHYIGAGGGDGIFKFDWGAGESFGDIVLNTLEEFII